MKKTILLLNIFILSTFAKAQEIKLVKDTLFSTSPIDSMNYIYTQKIIPFKDSGVVIIGYADSVLSGQASRRRIVVTALDKTLNTVWSLKLPFVTIKANISICKDVKDNTYICYCTGNDFALVKISPTGIILLNKTITQQIISATTIINKIEMYYNYLVIYGNIFSSQTSFYPFISLFNTNGIIIRKLIFPKSSSTDYRGLYNCSNLAITPDNNLTFTYQLDAQSSYSIGCCDSLLNVKWNKPFNIKLGSVNTLFCQGNKVVFLNVNDQDGMVSMLKYDSDTGSGGTKIDNFCSFKAPYTNLILPTKKGNYLNFGNYLTASGFDNGIDYFDESGAELAYFLSNTYNSRNGVSDACIVGTNIYTVAVRFADKYCDQPNNVWRGCLWLKKYNTDFLNQSMGLNESQFTNTNISIYPNPFTNEITIDTKLKGDNIKIEICNQFGNLIKADHLLKDNKIILDTKELSNGFYFVRVQNMESGKTSYTKILKLH